MRRAFGSWRRIALRGVRRFRCRRFSSLVTAVCSWLASSYVRSSRETRVSKLTKVPLRKKGSIVRAASLLKQDILYLTLLVLVEY